MIHITPGGATPPALGNARNFTGIVHIEGAFQPAPPARAGGATVTFEPGARTAWHCHPLGQTLVVTSGVGCVQQEGQPVREIRRGDVVWIPPETRHWHGATRTTAMTHVAVAESLDGSAVEWHEPVTDRDYNKQCHLTQNVTINHNSSTFVARVTPALAHTTEARLHAEVWNRPWLNKRDRSLVTLTAMVTLGHECTLTDAFEQAIENGVTPGELSETITHLAYYSGWGSAMGAVGPASEVFERHGVGVEQLPKAVETLLAVDEVAESLRAATVEENYGAVAPGVVQYTTEALFRELWLRPGLAPRDRCLVTVSSLIASGHVAQLTYHLGRAIDHGLTREQSSEVLTQLAFYAGWPRVFSALPVVKAVFENRVE